MKSDRAPAESVLKGKGLRKTPVRLGVLEVLAASRRPLDVPQIIAMLPGHADAVTVYRTLNTFVRKNIVHRIRGDDRAWRYALGHSHKRSEHQHPHFVCTECGRVECLAHSRIPADFVRTLGVARDYAVTYPEVVLHGVCPKCR